MSARSAWILGASLAVALGSSFVASPLARADQCAVVSRGQSDLALARLRQPGTWILELCEPCGEQLGPSARPYLVERVERVPWPHGAGGDDFEVRVNGRAVDLAYVFVHVGAGQFENLAALAGCPAEGVSARVRLPGWSPAGLTSPPRGARRN